MLSVKCHLKAKRKKNVKMHFVNKNLTDFFHILFCLMSYISVLNIVKTSNAINLRSLYKKH